MKTMRVLLLLAVVSCGGCRMTYFTNYPAALRAWWNVPVPSAPSKPITISTTNQCVSDEVKP